MGGLRELAQKYQEAVQKMKDDRIKNAIVIAGDALALVILRIQNKGIDADGGKFKPYYQEEVPIAFLRPGLNASKQAKFEKDVREGKAKASPFDWRKYMGLPTAYRNFTITGEMIRSFKPVVAEHSDFVTVVELKAGDKENQQKLNGASFNMGRSIIELNDIEKEMVDRANAERMAKLLSGQIS